ncbi:TPA: hypothetical protein UOJ25_001812 [Stenotrophomonas maltophilia]|nr:hypothetical protein [Stenotrophomonas maltophilia]
MNDVNKACSCPSGGGSLRHPCPAHPPRADVQPGGRMRQGDQAERGPWRSMDTCPRDGTVVRLRWGEDHVSPGWWSAPVAPVQNDDGTWPTDTGGFPWAFIDFNNGAAFVNHAVDTEYGPTHWAPYVTLSAQPSTGGQDAPFPWENFPAYLIDKCEGDTISEEGLQHALAAMAEDERYCRAARQPTDGLSWADYWIERGQSDVAHDFEAFSRAEAWALQRFPDAGQPVGQLTDAEIDARLNTLYRDMVASGQHNGGMSGVAWDRAVYRMASNQSSGNSGELTVDSQPVGEPVAWVNGRHLDDCIATPMIESNDDATILKPRNIGASSRPDGYTDIPLYRAPARDVDLVPGIVRCAKCSFQLHRTNLYLQSGTVGAGDSQTEPCPNGCGPLWPVTWETWAREGWAEVERLHLERADLSNQHSPTLTEIGIFLKKCDPRLVCEYVDDDVNLKVALQASLEQRQHVPQQPVCYVHPMDADLLRTKAVVLRRVDTYWSKIADAVPVYLGAPAQAVDPVPASFPDTQEVRDILGRPNFWCSPWANVLRMRGDEIPNKAEEEQAAVIRFMLNHYLANGADWAETAGAELDAIRKAGSQAVGK